MQDGLKKLNVPYSYGWSIVALTAVIKLATFPLTKKQASGFAGLVVPPRPLGCAWLEGWGGTCRLLAVDGHHATFCPHHAPC